jgi:hypothetical protein
MSLRESVKGKKKVKLSLCLINFREVYGGVDV